jgi:hypothetical protein
MRARSPILALLTAALSLVGAAGGCESSDQEGDDGPQAARGGATGAAGHGGAAAATGGAQTAGKGANTSGGALGHGGEAGHTTVTKGGSGGEGGTGDAAASGAGEGGKDTGGATGGRGSTAAGGSAGTSPFRDGSLGSSCASDEHCGEGLTCVTPASGLLDGKSPAGGLCTLACDRDADCRERAAGSLCVAFDAEATVSFCLEGCTTGFAGEPKCHRRTDVACTLLGLVSTDRSCETARDCANGELCARSEAQPVCRAIVTGCAPNCGGDFDCAPGNFCDFASGLCSPQAPTGAPIGSLCDPNAANDPCNGFCQARDGAEAKGVCAAFCTLAPGLQGCGWDGSGKADAACLYLTRWSSEPGIGDVGICGALCDCNADCPAAGDRCVDESNGAIMSLWGRAGYCRPLEAGEAEADTFEECP